MMENCDVGPRLTVEHSGTCRNFLHDCNNYLCDGFVDTNMSFYLGSSIDLNKSNSEMLSKICDVLGKYGTVFRPDLAFSSCSPTNHKNKFIVDINEKALSESDIGVFFWDLKNPSVGVPIELSMFKGTKILFCDNYKSITNSVYIKHYVDFITDEIFVLDSFILRIKNEIIKKFVEE